MAVPPACTSSRSSGAPIGGLLAGWLVEVGGTQLAFYVAGLVAVLTALVSAQHC